MKHNCICSFKNTILSRILMGRFSDQIYISFIIAIPPKLNYLRNIIFEIFNVFLILVKCYDSSTSTTCFLCTIRQLSRLLAWRILSIIRKYLVTANIHLSKLSDFSQYDRDMYKWKSIYMTKYLEMYAEAHILHWINITLCNVTRNT